MAGSESAAGRNAGPRHSETVKVKPMTGLQPQLNQRNGTVGIFERSVVRPICGTSRSFQPGVVGIRSFLLRAHYEPNMPAGVELLKRLDGVFVERRNL